MSKIWIDFKLAGGIFLACLLVFVAFDRIDVFWYLYTATILFLISYSIINEPPDNEAATKQYITYGILSGSALYGLFFAADWMLEIMPGHLKTQVDNIYARFTFDFFWHYLVLIFIIIPGEEIFWRGFILKRLMDWMNPTAAILAGAFLNAAAFYFTGYSILMIAAFVSGLAWGWLYIWKRSIPLVIISHLTFDLLLLIIFPLQ
ncbi:CPBP family intramembrane glutamic endopeptidase [Siminovitchia sp. 179-K 8D1 HS]|uniref:CPBP family intramembrane glutamic endopeptidase n=1 Tax=Siminovitchia sp. 179-K 8D1 HS TaxID=3142385 RepID=UPI0039A1C3D8